MIVVVLTDSGSPGMVAPLSNAARQPSTRMLASCRWYFHTRHDAAHVSPGGVPLGAGFSESTDDPPGALEDAAVVTGGSRSSFLLGLDSLGTKLSDSVTVSLTLLESSR